MSFLTLCGKFSPENVGDTEGRWEEQMRLKSSHLKERCFVQTRLWVRVFKSKESRLQMSDCVFYYQLMSFKIY